MITKISKSEKIRFLVKNIIAHFIYYSGILFLYRKIKLNNKAVILLYHGFYEPENPRLDYSPDGMYISPSVFKKQMRFLARYFNVISMNDLVSHINNGKNFPQNCCAITFDDGVKGIYDFAYPVLNKNKLPATVFLTTNFIDGGPWYWEERIKYLAAEIFSFFQNNSDQKSPELIDILNMMNMVDIFEIKPEKFGVYIMKKVQDFRDTTFERRNEIIVRLENELKKLDFSSDRLYLNWDEITTMKRDNIDFGGHTLSHCNLISIGEEESKREIGKNKYIIEKNIKSDIKGFAYPFGKYDETSVKLVRESGYEYANTTVSGFVSPHTDLFLLNRINIHEVIGINTPMFACRILKFLNSY